MIVTCPDCETQFDIPDDKYRPGRKARCSNCGVVFALPEPAGPAEASPPAMPPPVAETPEPGEPEAAPPPAPAPASPDDAVLAPQEKSAARKNAKNKKNLLIICGAVLVLGLLAYGGYKVYAAFVASSGTSDPERVTDGRTASSLGGASGDAGQAGADKEAARLAATRRLSLAAPQQYIERGNSQTGPIIVISGSVTNNFDTPKSLVLLEITLFDEKGRALVVREQYCGVTFQPLQLQTLSRDSLEKALNNQVVILTNNADIPPGGSVPFMALFFGYPDAAYEFEIKLIDVQDSAAPRNG